MRVAVIAALVAAAGCSKKAERPPAGALEIGEAQTIKSGPVGLGAGEAPATYALVDVTNTADRDVIASIGGQLLDVADNPLGATRPEMLRIGAGETRMFALVDERRRVLETASRIEVEVDGQSYAHADPRLVITGITNHIDQGRAVVAGYLENRGESEVIVMVIAGFYDAGGKPVERAAAPYAIDGGARRAIQHVGPEGSTRGTLFAGDFN